MIAFDIDGVVCDTHTPFRKYIVSRFGIEDDPTKYFLDIPGKTDREIHSIINSFILENYDLFKPYPDAIIGLKKFSKYLDKPLTFITARNKILNDCTRKMIKKFIPGIEFNIINSEEHNKGKDVGKRMYYVDDQYENLHTLTSLKMGFLMNRSWNKETPISSPNIVRVNTLIEVFELFTCSELSPGHVVVRESLLKRKWAFFRKKYKDTY